MSTVVTTQAEMDAAITSGASDIIIDSPAGVWLKVADSSRVEAWDSSRVEAGSHVAVMLHSGAAKIVGGVIIDRTEVAS